VYERLEDIREKRQPMSGLIADILQFHADSHGNIITRDEHMEAMGRKDETIHEMSRRIDDLNATVNSLTEKIKSVSNELGMALDEIKQRENDFREMRDDRNNIASINRVLQSTIEELRDENAGLREKVNGRRIFGRSSEKFLTDNLALFRTKFSIIWLIFFASC
jgi:chromosome segregation ATPase